MEDWWSYESYNFYSSSFGGSSSESRWVGVINWRITANPRMAYKVGMSKPRQGIQPCQKLCSRARKSPGDQVQESAKNEGLQSNTLGPHFLFMWRYTVHSYITYDLAKVRTYITLSRQANTSMHYSSFMTCSLTLQRHKDKAHKIHDTPRFS
jgi:hypothetical protein